MGNPNRRVRISKSVWDGMVQSEWKSYGKTADSAGLYVLAGLEACSSANSNGDTSCRASQGGMEGMEGMDRTLGVVKWHHLQL